MAIFFLPNIKAEDYDTFRGIINADFPDSFDVWAYEQSKLATQYLNRSQGTVVRHIEVDPHEFTEFLRKAGRTASRRELDNFAFHKSGLDGN